MAKLAYSRDSAMESKVSSGANSKRKSSSRITNPYKSSKAVKNGS